MPPQRSAHPNIDARRFETVDLSYVAALPPGDIKDMLAAADVRGWACVPLVRLGRARGIMAIDIFKPAGRIDCPESVARLASDSVANAIEREFLERERARLTARLERARRMQIIGSLASGIAHNLNNIIGAILGYRAAAYAGNGEPLGFERPADAIAACRVSPGRFDAVLVSHGASGSDGLHLAHILHEIMPQLPMLFATTSIIDVGAGALAESGIAEVLSSPLVSSELAAALAHCLQPTGILQA
jgi:CheY-like chemotaxis protein